MKFIDTAKIHVSAGHGGDGCVSFRREKYVPRGGPNGGNGGHGGNVFVVGNRNKQTLLDFKHMHHVRAGNGTHGKGKDMHGRRGDDLILELPMGTIVIDAETEVVLADLTEEGEPIMIAQGGLGGRGNLAFMTPAQRAPRIAEEGKPGEALEIILELKLIADVGIVGFPNAGKSTFISVVSAARPKIADYPFTTLTPNLGVVKGTYAKPYVIADMPGLIEGAADGAGLGHRFLKHIERTKVLLHFVDASAEESMVERYATIRNELDTYGESLIDKPEIIAATKMDSVNPENLEEFKAYIADSGAKLFCISSLTKDGLEQLLAEIEANVDQVDAEDLPDDDDEFADEEGF